MITTSAATHHLTDNKGIKGLALTLTIVAGALTIWHMHYQLKLTKIQLEAAQAEIKTTGKLTPQPA